MRVRLQKFLAEAGIASRRASEQVILAGSVSVNGVVVRELGTKVDALQDRVEISGKTVKAKRKLYVALHKPRGYLCSRSDPLKRRTVGALLPKEWQNLFTVGRLDYESEGLIFLTNDGDFSLRLTHPRFAVPKKYLATVRGWVKPAQLVQMKSGIVHDGEKLQAQKTRLLNAGHSLSLVELVLTEGRKREVRRLFEAQGLKVERLQRIQIGPIKLGELPSGRWRTLTEAEINSLLREGLQRSTSRRENSNNA